MSVNSLARSTIWGAAIAAALASCSSSSGSGGPGTAGTGGHGGNGAGGSGASGSGPCPVAMPAAASGCAPEGLVCQYGSDPRWECNAQATCTSGQWQISQPQCGAIVPPTAGCPATREAAAGNACDPGGAFCSYADGLNCSCSACPLGGPVTCNPASGLPTKWYCDAPNTDTQCPAARPRLGAACTPEGKQCVYVCGSDGTFVCQSGFWTAGVGSGCPISRREMKRDIHYLDQRELQDVAMQIKRMRLATWEYKDPALAGRRQIGFIIDDQPDIAAVDNRHGIVDLYGYTSMLAATVQAQERDIEALRRQVDALKSEIASTAQKGSRSRQRGAGDLRKSTRDSGF